MEEETTVTKRRFRLRSLKSRRPRIQRPVSFKQLPEFAGPMKRSFRQVYGRKVPYGYRAKRGKFIPGHSRTSGYYGRFSGSSGEQKFLDTSTSDVDITSTMTFTNIGVIAVGSGESGRVGRKLTVKSIHVRYQLVLKTATVAINTSNIVRCMLVQDTQTNGAQFAANQLFDSDDILSFRNLANSGRFKILFKREYTMQTTGGVPSGAAFVFAQANRYININKRVFVPMEYDDTDGTVSTQKSNSLWWITQAEKSVICGGAGIIRVRYTDR